MSRPYYRRVENREPRDWSSVGKYFTRCVDNAIAGSIQGFLAYGILKLCLYFGKGGLIIWAIGQ